MLETEFVGDEKQRHRYRFSHGAGPKRLVVTLERAVGQMETADGSDRDITSRVPARDMARIDLASSRLGEG